MPCTYNLSEWQRWLKQRPDRYRALGLGERDINEITRDCSDSIWSRLCEENEQLNTEQWIQQTLGVQAQDWLAMLQLNREWRKAIDPQGQQKRRNNRVQADHWLAKQYPTNQEQVSTIANPWLYLTYELDLTAFTNLQELNFDFDHGLTKVKLANCLQLKKLSLVNLRELSELDLSHNSQLTQLNLAGTDCDTDIWHLTNLVEVHSANPKVQLQWWLKQKPERTKDLPYWPKFFKLLFTTKTTQFFDFRWRNHRSFFATAKLPWQEFAWAWTEEGGEPATYWNLLTEWAQSNNEHLTSIAQVKEYFDQVWEQKQQFCTEIKELQEQNQALSTKLQDHETALTTARQALDQLRTELTQQTQTKQLCEQKIKDLESAYQQTNNLLAQQEQETQQLCTALAQAQTNYQQAQEQLKSKEQELTQQRDQQQTLRQQISAKEQELQRLRDQTTASTAQLRKELDALKAQLQTEQATYQQELAALHKELEQKQSTITNLADQLTNKDRERNELTVQLNDFQAKNTDLADQLTALAVSSGLLSQQIEQLQTQLTETEISEQTARCELAAKKMLVKDLQSTDHQQKQQITNYQNLLRTSDEKLSHGQRILQERAERIEQLEQEKNSIHTELTASQEKINELEANLLTANQQVATLETKLSELTPEHEAELTRLHTELSIAKAQQQQIRTQSQTELAKLKAQLTTLQQREQALAAQVKELTQPQQVSADKQTAQEQPALWSKVKQPALLIFAFLIIMFAYRWISSKLYG